MDTVEQVLSGQQFHEPIFLPSTVVSHLLELGKEDESKINTLVGEITALQNRLDGHTRRLALIRNVLAPIRTLPPEILSLIFHCYVQYRKDDDSELDSLYYQHLPPAILLSHVCSSWRKIASHLPSLWTYVPVFTTRKRRCMPGGELLKTWLTRSNPLCVKLHIKSRDDRDLGPLESSYLDCLLPSSARWQSLTLDMPFIFPRHLLERSKISAPNLETLKLYTRDIISYHSLSALEKAPKLSEVELISMDLGIDIWSTFKFPVHQIKVLTIFGGSDDADTVQRAVEECPLLEDCSVLLSDYVVPPRLDAPLKRPNLKSLRILFGDLQGAPEFLDVFTMPQLTDLEVSHRTMDPKLVVGDRHNVFRYLTSFQERSGFKLRSLIFCNLTLNQLSTDEMLRLLRSIPSIKDLCIRECGMDLEQLSVGLTANPQHEICAPNLTDVDMRKKSSNGTVSEFGIAIAEMVASRWKPGPDDDGGMIKWPVAKLTSFNLELGWPLAERAFIKLQECNLEGMPLGLKCGQQT